MPRIEKTQERWFDFPNDPDKGAVKFKNLSPGEIDEINDESFKNNISYKPGGKKGDLEPIIESKQYPKAFRQLPIKKAIVDWKNFFEADGKTEMKCTPENIERAIQEIGGFKDWAVDCRGILAKDIAKEKEAQAKNSKGSASVPVK